MVLLMMIIGLVVGGGLGFLIGFLVFRKKQQPGYPQQAQFAQSQQWQAAPPQQFPPQHGYGQQPRPPR